MGNNAKTTTRTTHYLHFPPLLLLFPFANWALMHEGQAGPGHQRRLETILICVGGGREILSPPGPPLHSNYYVVSLRKSPVCMPVAFQYFGHASGSVVKHSQHLSYS